MVKIKKDWSDERVMMMFVEEVGELFEAFRKEKEGKKTKKKVDIEKEFGDVLFNLVSLSNRFDVDLDKSIKKVMKDLDDRYCS